MFDTKTIFKMVHNIVFGIKTFFKLIHNIVSMLIQFSKQHIT